MMLSTREKVVKRIVRMQIKQTRYKYSERQSVNIRFSTYQTYR